MPVDLFSSQIARKKEEPALGDSVPGFLLENANYIVENVEPNAPRTSVLLKRSTACVGRGQVTCRHLSLVRGKCS